MFVTILYIYIDIIVCNFNLEIYDVRVYGDSFLLSCHHACILLCSGNERKRDWCHATGRHLLSERAHVEAPEGGGVQARYHG